MLNEVKRMQKLAGLLKENTEIDFLDLRDGQDVYVKSKKSYGVISDLDSPSSPDTGEDPHVIVKLRNGEEIDVPVTDLEIDDEGDSGNGEHYGDEEDDLSYFTSRGWKSSLEEYDDDDDDDSSGFTAADFKAADKKAEEEPEYRGGKSSRHIDDLSFTQFADSDFDLDKYMSNLYDYEERQDDMKKANRELDKKAKIDAKEKEIQDRKDREEKNKELGVYDKNPKGQYAREKRMGLRGKKDDTFEPYNKRRNYRDEENALQIAKDKRFDQEDIPEFDPSDEDNRYFKYVPGEDPVIDYDIDAPGSSMYTGPDPDAHIYRSLSQKGKPKSGKSKDSDDLDDLDEIIRELDELSSENPEEKIDKLVGLGEGTKSEFETFMSAMEDLYRLRNIGFLKIEEWKPIFDSYTKIYARVQDMGVEHFKNDK